MCNGPVDPPQEGPPVQWSELMPDCGNINCRQIDGKCMGWHCPHCGKATGQQGHDCPEKGKTIPVVYEGRRVGVVTDVQNAYEGLHVTMRIDDSGALKRMVKQREVRFNIDSLDT